MRKILLSSIALVALTALSFPVLAASCRIQNTTKYNFTVSSGNHNGQRVTGHSTTDIAEGRIIAKSDDGKGVGGSCKAGDHIKIVEVRGVLMIVPR